MSKVTETNKHQLLYKKLLDFFKSYDNYEWLAMVVKKKQMVSLRILDWLVTNYSKKHNVRYTIPMTNGKSRDFHLYMSYKGCLRAFSKRQFDPFARRDRITLNIHGDEINTTVAQMCFFKWCIDNRVFKYAVENISSIEKDMLDSIAHRYDNSNHEHIRKKRRELSRNNTHTHVRPDVPYCFNF